MRYYSTNNKNIKVSLRESVLKGLADDGGLFMPEVIPVMDAAFINSMKDKDFREISFPISQALFGEDIAGLELRQLVEDALNFDTPLKRISDNIWTLELFHGPTLAFKDVGARFMARMLRILLKQQEKDIHVLVATSGDTGSAVANGFLGVEGIRVHVLYPKGKVSKIQEIQFTTLGENISALEINGNFDDCQKLVKQAFSDKELRNRIALTSANSINLARLLPQTFYYFNGYRQLEEPENLVFCVPSGNFGNLTAGIIAARMGLPVNGFITSTNSNDIVPQYLKSGNFIPRSSIATIANAMDVGNPSNFARMLDLFENDHSRMKDAISGYSWSDSEIEKGISDCFHHTGYLPDPHGATGYLAALEHLKIKPDAKIIFLETAHPAKFIETVEHAAGTKVTIPGRLKAYFNREKKSIPLDTGFEEFKDYLMESGKF